MNIFGSVLSEEVMMKRTSGGDGCDSPGDYLRSAVNFKYLQFTYAFVHINKTC